MSNKYYLLTYLLKLYTTITIIQLRFNFDLTIVRRSFVWLVWSLCKVHGLVVRFTDSLKDCLVRNRGGQKTSG